MDSPEDVKEPVEEKDKEGESVTVTPEDEEGTDENDTGENTAKTDECVAPQLSKNQIKKQRKREKWLAAKSEKRREAKARRKQRRVEMIERGESFTTRKQLKAKKMKNSSCKIRVAIDLSLDEYMSEKDVNSLSNQLQHSYSANRRAENPLQFYFCGMCGKTKQRLEAIGDYKGWDVYVEDKAYDQMFPKESLVYLSSESPNVLTTLEEDKVYVIGGLVDHNRHKGLCHKLAEEKGIVHAKLPITEYLQMTSRKVLAINHVFTILLRYTESKDWKESFLKEMPARKQAQVKFTKKKQNQENGAAEESCVKEDTEDENDEDEDDKVDINLEELDANLENDTGASPAKRRKDAHEDNL